MIFLLKKWENRITYSDGLGAVIFFDSLSCCSLCIYLINRPIINFLFLRLDHRRVIKWCEIRKPFFQTHIISTLQKSKFDIWRLVKADDFFLLQINKGIRSPVDGPQWTNCELVRRGCGERYNKITRFISRLHVIFVIWNFAKNGNQFEKRYQKWGF